VEATVAYNTDYYPHYLSLCHQQIAPLAAVSFFIPVTGLGSTWLMDHAEAAGDIRISNQFLITRALHFAQPQAYYQASVSITLGRRF